MCDTKAVFGSCKSISRKYSNFWKGKCFHVFGCISKNFPKNIFWCLEKKKEETNPEKHGQNPGKKSSTIDARLASSTRSEIAIDARLGSTARCFARSRLTLISRSVDRDLAFAPIAISRSVDRREGEIAIGVRCDRLVRAIERHGARSTGACDRRGLELGVRRRSSD